MTPLAVTWRFDLPRSVGPMGITYALIAAEKAHDGVAWMCRLLDVSRSGFYDWERRGVSDQEQRREWLTERIRAVFTASHRTYGYRRVHAELSRQGVPVDDDLVRRLMRAARVVPVQVRTRLGLTVADRVDQHYDAELVCTAMTMATGRVQLPDGAIFHSDRGAQYTSHDFTNLLRDEGVRQSVGRTGICFDNAMAESFCGKIKTEWVRHRSFSTRHEARREIIKYIEGFYNTRRRHSTIHEVIEQKVTDAPGLSIPDFARDKTARFSVERRAWEALRRVVGYRIYQDLVRGWRITMPNLASSRASERTSLTLWFRVRVLQRTACLSVRSP